jgi:hypothetical protein
MLSQAYLAWPELTAPSLGAYLGGLALYIFLVVSVAGGARKRGC